MNYDFIINHINNSLKKVFSNYKGLYFYGSRNNGTERGDSDLDLVMITNEKIGRKEEFDIYITLGELEYELGVFIDMPIYSEEEFKNQFYMYDEVIETGKFYAA